MTEASAPPLPDTLSALITLAVEDAQKLDPDFYFPISCAWHSPSTQTGKCFVCFAGAVMAGTLGLPPSAMVSQDADVWMSVWPSRVTAKLKALESVRIGDYKRAQVSIAPGTALTGEQARALAMMPRPRYSTFADWRAFDAFIAEMKLAARDLEAVGL